MLVEAPLPGRAAKASRLRVLVVEDDPAVAKMLRFCLREAGFDPVGVSTGGEALLTLQRQPPDAVVLDLQLPDGQGGAVLDSLRRLEGSANAPVWVVISALDRDEAAKRCGPLGRHFLAKPFDPWELVAILKDLLAAQS